MHIESHFSFLRFNFDRLSFIERKCYCFYKEKLSPGRSPIECLKKHKHTKNTLKKQCLFHFDLF